MTKEQYRMMGLLNRGYGYKYIAREIFCTEEEVRKLDEELRESGVCILENFALFFKVEVEDIKKHTRRRGEGEGIGVDDIRSIIIYLLREYGEMTFPMIGKLLDRDHTTIIHSYKKIKDKISMNADYEKNFSELIQSTRAIKGVWFTVPPINRPKRTLEINTGSGVSANSSVHFGGERMNIGKGSYKQYLEEYKEEIKESREARMLQAKQTIEDLRKWRKRNGMKELDHPKINWSRIENPN